MKKLHLALGVADIEATVADYSQRFGQAPELVIAGAYALWRTDTLNVSVRKVAEEDAGKLRHLGWEVAGAEAFTSDLDCNGILWEQFAAEHQAAEIKDAWPEVSYEPEA
ncbi:hypothetical protein [Alkalilimnicola ehrlichii]|nr:hypothetical protein [Alkalilimnicola ehrlichii]